MKEMQDAGIVVSMEEMRLLLEDRSIRQWLGGIECLHYPSVPAEFGIPLPPAAPELPLCATTPAGQQFLKLATARQA